VQIHSHLALDGVTFLLATVPTVSFLLLLLALLWSGSISYLGSLYALLEAVNHHRKLWKVGEQLVESASMLTTWVRHSHGVTTNLGQHRQHSSEQARHSGVGYSKQEAEYLIGRIEPQPNDSEQYLLLHGQGKGVSPTYGSEPIVARVAFVLSSHEQRANILDKLLKLHRPQSCEGVQHVRMEL